MIAAANVLGWIMARPWLIVSGALAVALGVMAAQVRITGAQRDAARAETGRLQTEIDRQNEYITTWEIAADRQRALAEQAGIEAAKARKTAAAKIQAALALPVPRECPAAIRWGAEQGQRMGREWIER